VERLDLALPSPTRGYCKVGCRLAQGSDPDVEPATGKVPSGDITVAAVVPGSAQDQCRRRTCEAKRGLGQALARPLHEFGKSAPGFGLG
jgi:hypothetical protein